MTSPRLLIATALAAFVAPLAHAADTPAKPAAQAPAEAPSTISPEGLPTTWLQGEPVKAFAPGKLYIFECWATWCGPCLQAMPHMEALHQKFKDRKEVQIVGINVMDGTASEKLMPFLKAKKLDITYTMAADGKDGPVNKHWLTPLGVTGIPFAMAVREGKILWRGHPAQLEDTLIEAMTKPDFSPEKAPMTKEQRRAALRPKYDLVRKAASVGDLPAVEKALRDYAAEAEESDVVNAADTAFRICLIQEREADALAVLRFIVNQYPKSRWALLKAGHLALDTERLEKKDAAFALDCADRALAMQSEDIAAMELKAAALFAKGERESAIALQEKALKATKLSLKIEALRADIAAAKPAAK